MNYTFIDELKVKEKEVLYNFLKEFPTIEVREALNKIDNMQGQELIDCLNYLKKEVEDKKIGVEKPIFATTTLLSKPCEIICGG